MTIELELNGIVKQFGNKNLFKIPGYVFSGSGRPYVITGQNGVGKTTLFNMIYGYDKDFCGEIKYNGNNMYYMLQEEMLFRSLTVQENIELFTNSLRTDTEEKTIEGIKLFSLDGILNTKVNSISVGERKRLALLFVFLFNPDIILLDEPTAALEKRTAVEYMNTIISVFSESLIVIISHDEIWDERFNVLELLPEGLYEKQNC